MMEDKVRYEELLLPHPEVEVSDELEKKGHKNKAI
jgi:hypothetical protein